jgi:hypothetical protein
VVGRGLNLADHFPSNELDDREARQLRYHDLLYRFDLSDAVTANNP